MFLWVKVEVYPDQNPTLAMDPERPTIYVLAARGLSDLLVLSSVCDHHQLPNPLSRLPLELPAAYHSVYSLASRSPLTDWIQKRQKTSAMLNHILLAFENNPDLDLQIVPVSVYWGRPLARQKSWLQVLFADRWALAGRTRKFFTILIHGRNTRLIFSQAIDLKSIIEKIGGDESSLQQHLLTILNQQRTATNGPQIPTQQQIAAKVIEDPQVQTLLSSQGDRLSKNQARAQRYCREIFADCTQPTIELMVRLLRAFWNRFYAGIEIYHSDRVRECALTHQLVYVPCHRSHVDYLLLSYIIYKENLALPYIAAGNNLDLPVIGRILRGGGAFFIRRSFKDNLLYTAIMRAYLAHLVKLGVPLEYFIEGGRSRSGRLLQPKFGMLSMTIEAYIKRQTKPMAFIPVYIGYEKLLEGNSYLGELYGGKKKHESTFGAFGAIFKLQGHYGKVTASFGEPIELDRLLDQHCQDWREHGDEVEQKPDWYQASLVNLANQILIGINRACVINPVNAIATILLATPRQSIEVEELIAQATLHRCILSSITGLESIRIEGEVDREQIERIAAQKIIHIRQHELGDMVYLKPKEAVLIGYYRNNTLHGYVLPAIIACCFATTLRLKRSNVIRKVTFLYPFLKSELQLPWDENQLQEVLDQCISALVSQSLLFEADTDLRRPQRSDRRFIQLMRLAQVVQPIMERYYMAFIVLWQTTSSPLSESELEHRCHLLAQKTSMIYGMNSPDFYDRPLFRDFIQTMLEEKYLILNCQQKLEFAPDFDYIRLDLRNLLSTEVRSSIQALISASSQSASKN